ncbi:hypothetical protein [Rhodococcus sp. UNC363MFTsu5.1]|uniref:hypothetical protein n=1 Tax=Rhodococcus sp. UNC363MFTsu5.1 TaxID=1449069 RepID=UPI00068A2BC6|nr:hypothetical protein [Rhodococcus sp. UNC363MFTsu5.1]
MKPTRREQDRTETAAAPPSFRDRFICLELRFSLGIEETTGRHYLAIPAANGVAEAEEFYEIDAPTHERFAADPGSAAEFIRRCRNRELDALLILDPGPARGV